MLAMVTKVLVVLVKFIVSRGELLAFGACSARSTLPWPLIRWCAPASPLSPKPTVDEFVARRPMAPRLVLLPLKPNPPNPPRESGLACDAAGSKLLREDTASKAHAASLPLSATESVDSVRTRLSAGSSRGRVGAIGTPFSWGPIDTRRQHSSSSTRTTSRTAASCATSACHALWRGLARATWP